MLKSLYGTLEAARIWYEVLRDFLLSLDFVPNAKDVRVFNKMVNGKQWESTWTIRRVHASAWRR